MESLYHQTNHLVQQTQEGFALLERTPASEGEMHQQKLNAAIETIIRYEMCIPFIVFACLGLLYF